MISLDDGKTEMAVVTDVTMGGSSMSDGSLEVMTHRRLTHDDHRGVGEPLDEVHVSFVHLCVAPLYLFGELLNSASVCMQTMCGTSGIFCAGLTMRGVALLVVDTIENAHATRRELVDLLNL